jgi:hypothetical protein
VQECALTKQKSAVLKEVSEAIELQAFGMSSTSGSVTIVPFLPVGESAFFEIGTRRSHFMKLLRFCCLALPGSWH